MELLFRLIEFMVQALLEGNKDKQQPIAPQSRPAPLTVQVPTSGSQGRLLAPTARSVIQDAGDSGDAVRALLTALGVIVLILMGIALALHLGGVF